MEYEATPKEEKENEYENEYEKEKEEKENEYDKMKEKEYEYENILPTSNSENHHKEAVTDPDGIGVIESALVTL